MVYRISTRLSTNFFDRHNYHSLTWHFYTVWLTVDSPSLSNNLQLLMKSKDYFSGFIVFIWSLDTGYGHRRRQLLLSLAPKWLLMISYAVTTYCRIINSTTSEIALLCNHQIAVQVWSNLANIKRVHLKIYISIFRWYRLAWKRYPQLHKNLKKQHGMGAVSFWR